MASFTVTGSGVLTPSDGPSIAKTIASAGMNAKEVMDDIFGPGPLSIDLAPRFADCTVPKYLILIADGDGVQLKFDGAAGFATKAVKFLMMEFDAVAGPGVLDLELQAIGLAQRIRAMLVGDPA